MLCKVDIELSARADAIAIPEKTEVLSGIALLNFSWNKMIEETLAQKIRLLSEKYENADFLKKDPSQFMHRFSEVRDQEAAAFIAANLAFGRRDQILSHVEMILDAAGKSPVEWILSKGYVDFFPSFGPEAEKSFYRMYTNRDMALFFDGLRKIFSESETAGEYFRTRWEKKNKTEENIKKDVKNRAERNFLHFVIEDAFDKSCGLIPHTKDSAAKKLNMMLRWLVRGGSPVDLGIWEWGGKKNLLMPLDVHVMRQANELGLLKSSSANLKAALELTQKMSEIFPEDPLRGDFALFGYDVEK